MKLLKALLFIFLIPSFAAAQTDADPLKRQAIGIEVITAKDFIAAKSTAERKFKVPKNEAVVVTIVYPNSPAFKAGLQPDDLIEKIGASKTEQPQSSTKPLQSLNQEKIST